MKKIIFVHWYAWKEMCKKLKPLNIIWEDKALEYFYEFEEILEYINSIFKK